MMLSIIVPTYLMTEALRDECNANLRTMRAVAQVPTELVIVDNGSAYPPDVPDPPRTYRGWYANKGIAPAWNKGVKLAVGDVLAFVTSTTIVQPGWDEKLCAVAQSGRYIAMPLTNGAQPYGIGVTGWCWVVRADLFDEVGPFDEAFVPVQYEDSDWFWRAIQVGIELVNVRGANVLRGEGRKTLKAAPWADRLDWIHWSNRLRFSFKHGNDPYDTLPFWKTPLRIVDSPIEVTA